MSLDPDSYLLLALLGGLVGTDTVSCMQAMISRPLVAATLAGLLVGDVGAGLWAGALLEVVSLRQLPIGAAHHWDTGPAAVVAAVAAAAGSAGPAGTLVGVGFGVLLGWLGGVSLHLLRRLNSRLVANETQAPLSAARLSALHLGAMALDFLRAALLTLLGVGLAALLVRGVAAPGASTALAAAALLAATSLALGADAGVMARGRTVWQSFALAALVSAVVTLWIG